MAVHLPSWSTWPKPSTTYNIPPSNTGQNLGLGIEMYLHNTAYGFQNIEANFYITEPDKQNCICFNKESAKAYSQFTDLIQKAGECPPSINQLVKLESTATLTTGF